MSDKQEYPRSFYFKLYKMFCKMLHVTCLCYGKMNKHDKTECIYGIDAAGQKLYVMTDNIYCSSLKISKRAIIKDDMQKSIVKQIMKALETSDVFLHNTMLHPLNQHVIPKRLCFEKCIIEYDMNVTQ